ncbi:MAG: hypothetical protein JWQ68_2363 [Cryobacterium sp.]|nr:hypothetical protein [Cryobacterium sp.]
MNCRICGAQLPAGAMFCGECGSSTTATRRTRKRPEQLPSDTTIIQPLAPPTPTVISVPLEVSPLQAAPRAVEALDVPDRGGVPSAPAAVPSPVAQEPPAHRALSPDRAPEAGPVRPPVALARDVPESEPLPASDIDLVPAFPAARPSPVRFLLQFSTGESVPVHGTGLVGRRPLPQPSEFFDHLVQIADTGMSVSKSHLEFGLHGGDLWVSDRFSGNGTVVRRHGEAPLRCEPGRRYLVPRGSRVEIGDQFFVVT